MKLNKDSKVVRISAFAEGHHSGTTAYGELYIPDGYYKKNDEKLKGLTVYVCGLDGKNSEIKCHIEFEIFTIEYILRMEDNNRYENRNIDEKLFYNFCNILELNDIESKILNNFSNGLLNLEKVPVIKEIEHVLSEDTIIDGMLIPEGTVIRYTISNDIIDDREWELFDFDLA